MYDKYENKIIRRARFIRSLYKIRVVLISLFTIAFATSNLYLFGKGAVINGVDPENVYIYGEEIDFVARAILSEVSYEFRKESSDTWQSEVPHKVGTYLYRPRGANNFSNYYYGNEKTFTIIPKKINITINENQLTYGTKPTIFLKDSLIGGDYLDDSYDFIYEDTDTLKWHIDADLSTLNVYSNNNENVTNCYEFISEAKTVTINKRLIVLQTRSDNKTYDGEELINENFVLAGGSLLPGESVIVTNNTAILNVGKVSNSLDFIVVDSQGVDVSQFYVINVQTGNLEIFKRQINFKSATFDYVYDGEAHTFTSNDISLTSDPETLLAHHTSIITITNNDNYIDVGEYTNSFSVAILEDSVDVSANYDIKYDYGKTTITKRLIKVTAGSTEKIYDKKKIQLISYNVDTTTPLAAKDEIVGVSADEFIDSGTYANEQKLTIVDRLTQVNVDKNYTVETKDGTIVIHKKPITVHLKKLTKIYDGSEHGHTNLNDLDYNPYELIESDEIIIINSSSATEAGTYNNDDIVLDIVDKSTGLSNLKNYELTVTGSENSLVIKKLALEIKIMPQSKLYDDLKIVDTLDAEAVRYEITSGDVAPGDYIDFKYLNNPHLVGSYDIQSELKIYRMGSDTANTNSDTEVTTNYDITIDSAEFKIDARSLIIETVDIHHEYNRIVALPHNEIPYSIRGDGLVEDHYIEAFDISAEFVDVGSYSYAYDVESLTIHNSRAEDVTKNYNIVFINSGKRIIEPRKLKITMAEASKMYDGQPFSSDKHTVDRLLSGDWIELSNLPTVTHVFEGYINNPDDFTNYQIFTENGLNVTSNYEINEINESVIYRTPRPITLTSTSHTKIFDNLPFMQGEILIDGYGLANGDTLEYEHLLSKGDVKHVHESGANTFTYQIINNDGLDVTENYSVDVYYGTLSILPLQIGVKMLEINSTYNGSDHTLENYDQLVTARSSPLYINEGLMLDGFNMYGSIYRGEPIIDAGLYATPATSFYITHASDDVYMSDFAITFIDQPYNIAKRDITVQSASGSKQFDNKPFDQSVAITNGSLAPGDEITYGEVEGITSVVENALNNIGKITITNQAGEDVTHNYNITKIFGRVTIYEIY